MPKITSLDHLVLTCASIPRTIAFYTRNLGMKHETFGAAAGSQQQQRHALLFGHSKINLHQAGSEFEPKAQLAKPGTADLCFLSETKVEEVLEHFKREGIEVLEGGKVVSRTGARGKLRSVYVRDPDGNLIEVSNYE